eukprot:11331278-Heterocapsa_arctica.AAC.1
MDSQHGQVSSDDDDAGADKVVRSFEAVSATSMLDLPRKKSVGIKCPDCAIGDTGTGIHIV